VLSLDEHYHKIQLQPGIIDELLVKRGVKAISRKSTEIVLGFLAFTKVSFYWDESIGECQQKTSNC
jgi:hypothetical protein